MNTKTIDGVMIIKNGKAWQNGIPTNYGPGYVAIVDGSVYEAEFVNKPSDVTYKGSPYLSSLEGASIVKVRRTVSVELLP